MLIATKITNTKEIKMKKLFVNVAAIAIVFMSSAVFAQSEKPTIVLVHGAFADSSSWNGVTKILEKDRYKVVAAANPLRGLKGDAEYVSNIIASLKTPVVLVGHSYGGMVISAAANGNSNVMALVYVDAFAPEAGENAFGLSAKFPGSTLGPALAEPIPLSGGDKDLYIQQDKYWTQFAADVSEANAKLMAAAQRPVTEAALTDLSSEPAWKNIPSWFVFGDKDKNIPPQTLAFMAERAKSKGTVVVKGGSHVAMISNPSAVAGLIKRAASMDR